MSGCAAQAFWQILFSIARVFADAESKDRGGEHAWSPDKILDSVGQNFVMKRNFKPEQKCILITTGGTRRFYVICLYASFVSLRNTWQFVNARIRNLRVDSYRARLAMQHVRAKAFKLRVVEIPQHRDGDTSTSGSTVILRYTFPCRSVVL